MCQKTNYNITIGNARLKYYTISHNLIPCAPQDKTIPVNTIRQHLLPDQLFLWPFPAGPSEVGQLPTCLTGRGEGGHKEWGKACPQTYLPDLWRGPSPPPPVNRQTRLKTLHSLVLPTWSVLGEIFQGFTTSWGTPLLSQAYPSISNKSAGTENLSANLSERKTRTVHRK